MEAMEELGNGQIGQSPKSDEEGSAARHSSSKPVKLLDEMTNQFAALLSTYRKDVELLFWEGRVALHEIKVSLILWASLVSLLFAGLLVGLALICFGSTKVIAHHFAVGDDLSAIIVGGVVVVFTASIIAISIWLSSAILYRRLRASNEMKP